MVELRDLKDEDAILGCEIFYGNIPDDFKFMQPELIEILEARLAEYFEFLSKKRRLY